MPIMSLLLRNVTFDLVEGQGEQRERSSVAVGLWTGSGCIIRCPQREERGEGKAERKEREEQEEWEEEKRKRVEIRMYCS